MLTLPPHKILLRNLDHQDIQKTIKLVHYINGTKIKPTEQKSKYMWRLGKIQRVQKVGDKTENVEPNIAVKILVVCLSQK